MYVFENDPENLSRKLAEKIRKLQEEKVRVDNNLKERKKYFSLAYKIGVIILEEFKGKPFEYDRLEEIFDKNFTEDFDRQFFSLQVLSSDDPRKGKKRGRKSKEEKAKEPKGESKGEPKDS